MKKILVVDDDRDFLDTLKSVLEYAGYGVLLSYDGQEGITMAKAQKPDLVLLDFMMPRMDGAETAEILKSDPLTKDIPVIFLTGLVAKEDETSGLKEINIGGEKCKSIAKPFENEKLLAVVKSALNGKQG